MVGPALRNLVNSLYAYTKRLESTEGTALRARVLIDEMRTYAIHVSYASSITILWFGKFITKKPMFTGFGLNRSHNCLGLPADFPANVRGDLRKKLVRKC